MKPKIVAACLSLLASTAVARADTRLVVPNPSFERTLGDDVQGWELMSRSENTAEIIRGDVPFGHRALHLRCASDGKSYVEAVSTRFPVKGGQHYTLAFSLRALKSALVYLHAEDAPGNPVGFTDHQRRAPFFSFKNPRWKRSQVSFTPEPSAVKLYLRFRVFPGQEAWVDGVQIDSGDATPFARGQPIQCWLAPVHHAWLAGAPVTVTAHTVNGGATPFTGQLWMWSLAGREGDRPAWNEAPVALRISEVSVAPGGEATVDTEFSTDGSETGPYRIRMQLFDGARLLTESVDVIHLGRPPEDTIYYGFYSLRAPSNPVKRVQALNDMQAAGMNLVGYYVPRMTGLTRRQLLDDALTRNMAYIPLLEFFFGLKAESDAEYSLDADGQRIEIWHHDNLSLISSTARRAAARRAREEISTIKDHPAFCGRYYFGDDVAIWRGKPSHREGPLADYGGVATRAFREKTGLAPPRPDPDSLTGHTGIIPDGDPWMQWMLFRCDDMMGDYQQVVADAVTDVCPDARGGPMHGRVWDVGVGIHPALELDDMGLLTYYSYPDNPLQHLVDCDLARLGGRDKELWVTPLFYSGVTGKQVTAEYLRAGFFGLLAGHAKALVYYGQTETDPGECDAVWREAAVHGELLRRHGRFLRELQRARRHLAVLISFSTDAYQVYNVDRPHLNAVRATFLTLLRAQLPVEIIGEEDIFAGRLANYDTLLLPHITTLRRSVHGRIVDWAGAGGTVLLDSKCRIDIAGSTRLDSEFTADYDDPIPAEPATVTAAVKRARRDLYPYVQPTVECSRDDVFVIPMRHAEEDCQFVVSANLARPVVAMLRWPRSAPRYDLFEDRRLERAPDGTVTLRLAPGEGRLLLSRQPDQQARPPARPPALGVQIEHLDQVDAAGRNVHTFRVAFDNPVATPTTATTRVRLPEGVQALTPLPLTVKVPAESRAEAVVELALTSPEYAGPAAFRIVVQHGAQDVGVHPVRAVFRAAPVPPPVAMAMKTATAIQIDGDLSEWHKEPCMRLDERFQVHKWQTGRWAGPTELSAVGRLCWNAEALYFAIRVRKAGGFRQDYGGADVWQNDCIQLAVSSDAEIGDRRYLGERDRSLAFTRVGDKPHAFEFAPRKAVTADVDLAVSTDGDFTIYEARLPWAYLGIDPAVGKKLALAWTANYTVTGKFAGWIQWCDGLVGGLNPAKWGTVRLVSD